MESQWGTICILLYNNFDLIFKDSEDIATTSIENRCVSKQKSLHYGLKSPSSISPPIFHPCNAFSTAVTRLVDRLWRLRAQTTCLRNGYKHKIAKCCNSKFCPIKHKNGDQSICGKLCLAKCLTHNISTTMRDTTMVSKNNLYTGNCINCISGVQWSGDWWRHVTLKGQGRDPNVFEP